MKPTLEDFATSSARWDGKHLGVAYQLNWHDASSYSPQGTWCWYILISDEQFYPEDWAKLRFERQDTEFNGSWRRHWSYETFPDIDPHGGWTFGEMTIHLGRDGKEHEHVKVGCDYAHSWDRDGGYWEGKVDVEGDVKRSIELLVKMFPRRKERCGYCGKWDDSENMYTAINGARVNKDQIAKLRENGWPTWLPAETDEPAAIAKASA